MSHIRTWTSTLGYSKAKGLCHWVNTALSAARNGFPGALATPNISQSLFNIIMVHAPRPEMASQEALATPNISQSLFNIMY